ncbi:MAG: hypothetical protein ACK47B_24515 [Armatimonadota bacterium]
MRSAAGSAGRRPALHLLARGPAAASRLYPPVDGAVPPLVPLGLVGDVGSVGSVGSVGGGGGGGGVGVGVGVSGMYSGMSVSNNWRAATP